MSSRIVLSVVCLVSLATSVLLVASFAAIATDEPVHVPTEAASSSSETPSEHGSSKERSDGSGNASPTSTPSDTGSQKKESAPRSKDIEPIGRPMLA